MIGTGVLKIEPVPGDDLVKEYIDFSARINHYKIYDEFFSNP